ncbi:S1C family serine protease [Chloroflexota bacterium]
MKKIKNKILVLTLVLMLTVTSLTGCIVSAGEEETITETPPVTENITSGENEWALPGENGQTSLLPSIADVVARVKPAVVSINTEIVTRDMFNRQYIADATGSGWIISEDGYIVTNNHVVEDAESITVILDDGRSFNAEIIGTDVLTDLAVVKINSGNLPVAKVGDSEKLRIGDWVVAIGNSLGQGVRATQGIVSRQGASVEVDYNQTLYGLIETDAAINPGNSGGPLVNMAGEVIGITNAKYVETGVESVGYAISTETAVPVIEQLINTGEAIHPWLGVSPYTVDDYVVDRFSLSVDKGAFLKEVVEDSPAGSAGLQIEDVIVSFAGRKIESVDDLIEGIRLAKVGQEVEIVYWRGAAERTVTTILIERPSIP